MRCIQLSSKTSALLDAKKNLEYLYDEVSSYVEKEFCDGSKHEKKLGEAFEQFNDVVLGLLIEQIDTQSSESDYKVIWIYDNREIVTDK